MTIARTEKEIDELHLEALEAVEAQGWLALEESPEHQAGYQRGVADALDWLMGCTETRPGDAPEDD